MTGSNGRVGKILKSLLKHEITDYDLPDNDVLDYENLAQAFNGQETVIHLAWKTDTDNYLSNFHDSDNTQMAFNVYRAAVEAGVKRVIMASSIHASMPVQSTNDPMISPYALPYPDSPYGAGKVFVESLGRYYAEYKKLEVVCLRFGGVGWGRQDLSDPEHRFWLSDEDCIQLVERCLEAEDIQSNYMIINAVSDNEGRIHDLTNVIGWKPMSGIR